MQFRLWRAASFVSSPIHLLLEERYVRLMSSQTRLSVVCRWRWCILSIALNLSEIRILLKFWGKIEGVLGDCASWLETVPGTSAIRRPPLISLQIETSRLNTSVSETIRKPPLLEAQTVLGKQKNTAKHNFYRATRMHSAEYAVARCMSVRPSVRPSVCLSVTHQYCV